MNTNETEDTLFGVHRGIIAGQFDRVDELNDRVASRHFPDRELQPNFSPRPVPTKYALFPVIERRTPAIETIREMPRHSIRNNFNPATRNGPVSSYLANVDTETILRNQIVAIQRGADQGMYVPASSSDLYNVHAVGRSETQTHPLLFDRNQYATTESITPGIGQDRLHNHTRTQLRGTGQN